MAARAYATRPIGSNSAFAQQLMNAVRSQVVAEVEEIGADAVRRANAIVAREFNNNRSSDRRRGGEKLLNSFVFAVERGAGQQLAVLRLQSSAPAVKVNSLNSGSSAHAIGAGGKKLSVFGQAFVAGERFRGSSKQFQRRKGSETKGHLVTGPVQHPGTVGSHFMERALEQAVTARLKQAVRITRRR